MNERTRKLMMMYDALYHRNDIDKLYVSRKGGRGLISIEDIVDTSIRRLEGYIKKDKERVITDTMNSDHKQHKQHNVLYIDLWPGQKCHSKDGGSAYSIGVGELGWQNGTR